MRENILYSTNRFIREKVTVKLMEREKSYAQQPGLLAFPSGAPKGADLGQIQSQNIEELMKNGYFIQKEFIKFEEWESIYKELIQLQREGRFQSIRTMQNIMEQKRNDQVLKFNYTALGDEVEVKSIKKICEKLSWLPFEFNKYIPDLSLQVNENMDIHYFSEKESYYNKHKNSDKKFDTGVKLTVILMVREYNKLDTEDKVRFTLYQEDEAIPIDVKKGDLIVVKSRELAVEYLKHFEKTFYVCSYISGPLKPHE